MASVTCLALEPSLASKCEPLVTELKGYPSISPSEMAKVKRIDPPGNEPGRRQSQTSTSTSISHSRSASAVLCLLTQQSSQFLSLTAPGCAQRCHRTYHHNSQFYTGQARVITSPTPGVMPSVPRRYIKQILDRDKTFSTPDSISYI
jgi:hypothetical protein